MNEGLRLTLARTDEKGRVETYCIVHRDVELVADFARAAVQRGYDVVVESAFG